MSSRAVAEDRQMDWEARIEELEESGRRAFLSRDAERLARLWSEELVVNSPLGRVLSRDEVLDLLRRGVIAHASYEIVIEAARRHGDLVIVMGHDFVADAADAAPIQRRFTDVWRAEADSWRMVARHASLAGPPPQGPARR